MDDQTVFLGIDLGTSSIKLTLLNSNLFEIFTFSKEYPISSIKPGFAEQDPDIWIAALQTGLSKLGDFLKSEKHQLKAIGVTGQMHSLVCLDKDYKVTRPAILWSDRRSSEIVETLNTQINKKNWGDWIGNPIATGYTLPSWIWLLEQEPWIAEKTHYLVQPKDFLRLWLTGELFTDPSDASATGFYHPGKQTWSEEILQIAKLTPENFPKQKPSLSIGGFLRKEISREFKLPDGIPIIVGGGDQAVQALAFNATHTSDCLITIGSGGQVFIPTKSPIPDDELRMNLYCHIIPNLWHYEAATLSAGLSFRWLKSLLRNSDSYQELADGAAGSALDNELFFLPYLNGERTPWMDPQISGAFLGLHLNHTPADLSRAVMEGVVYSIGQALDTIRASGLNPTSTIISGGASIHPFWCQLVSNVIDLPVRKNKIIEGSARGAAIAAWVGVENPLPVEAESRISQSNLLESIYQPDSFQEDIFKKYERFKKIYPKIKGI